jgi:hypothetical protein
MLTGSLPYASPSPADVARLMRGELISAPRVKNPKIPKVINDIVLRTLAPDLSVRYARASDLLNDILAARSPAPRPRHRSSSATPADESVAQIQSRLKAREAPQPRFCWHCRKPLQARTAKCPFCGEAQ